jgi:hypothetical protein
LWVHLKETQIMDDEWSPIIGDRVYIEDEQQAGQVIGIESEGGTVLYRVEMDSAPAGKASSHGPAWGYDPPEQLSCTIDELTAN